MAILGWSVLVLWLVLAIICGGFALLLLRSESAKLKNLQRPVAVQVFSTTEGSETSLLFTIDNHPDFQGWSIQAEADKK